MKKSSGAGKIILIILLVALVVAIAAILMPVALIGGVGAIWYFTKRKPDIKKRNISIAVAVVGLLGTIFITPAVLRITTIQQLLLLQLLLHLLVLLKPKKAHHLQVVNQKQLQKVLLKQRNQLNLLLKTMVQSTPKNRMQLLLLLS